MNKCSIYEHLYDITKVNLEKSGENLSFSKQDLIYGTSIKPGCIDLSSFYDYDMLTTLSHAYIGMLYRLPEKEAVENWKKRNTEPVNIMKEKIITSIENSHEAVSKGTIVYNNIYAKRNKIIMQFGSTTEKSNVYINKIYNIYKKTPKIFKYIIRGILGIKES